MSEAPINSNKEVPGVGLGRITRFFPLAWRHGSAMSNVGSGGYGPGIEPDPLIRKPLKVAYASCKGYYLINALNPKTLNLTEIVLEGSGFTIHVAKNPKEPFAIFVSHANVPEPKPEGSLKPRPGIPAPQTVPESLDPQPSSLNPTDYTPERSAKP